MEIAISIDQKDLEAQVSVPRVHTWVVNTIQLLRSLIVFVGSVYAQTWFVDETVDHKVPAKSWILDETRQQRKQKPRRKLNVVDVENMYRLIESHCHGNGDCARVQFEDEVRDRKVIRIQRKNAGPVCKPANKTPTLTKIPTEKPRAEIGRSNIRNSPRYTRRVDRPNPEAFVRKAERGRRKPARVDKTPTPQQVKEKKRRQAKSLKKRVSLEDRDLRQFAIRNAWRKSRLEGCH